MNQATMTSKGQLTVPKAVRERLGLKAGDRLEFQLERDGTARLLPVTLKVADTFGALSAFRKRKPVSVVKMDEAIRRALRKVR